MRSALVDGGAFEGGIVPKLLAAARAARSGLAAEIGIDGGGRMSRFSRDALLPTYPETSVTFVEGDGVWLIDQAGRRYLDFAAGIAVVGLGHRHPAPLAAAHAQLDRLWHASNLYGTEPAARARAAPLGAVRRRAGVLLQLRRRGERGRDQVRAQGDRQAGRDRARGLVPRPHARRALRHRPAREARGVRAAVPGARFARPNDIASLHAAAADDVGLILLEPVLGEGGVIPLEPAFLAAAAALADELGALLAFDEVQTGVGRTGTFFAFEQLGVRPQLVTLAKALANGLPIGCLLVADDAPSRVRSPATTARPSAAIRSSARQPSRCATRSTTSCSRRCG